MGRKKRWHEAFLVKFPAGTRDRIDSVLAEKEERTGFIRRAVEREIERREGRAPAPRKRLR
jgi:hypothetical protein